MQRARALIGKHVLVGIAYLASDGKTETGQMQFHGIVRAADSKRGIALEWHGKLPGETRILPPDTRYFCEAPPGT